MEKRTFGVSDYAVFGVVLAVSSVVGIFYAIKDFRKKSEITEDYLLAKRQMHYVPVAISLTVSFMSAITILGTPAEVYSFGLIFWWLLPSFLIAAVVISEIYIPIYYRLKIISSYEYLELRFNRVVRVLATIVFIIETIMYVGIVIYAPALALSEVTGFDLWTAILSTGLVCTFYTTLGGLKGVIWTDVFQIFVMCAGLLAVIIEGSIRMDGFSNIWRISDEGGRLMMNDVSADPRVRHSVWTLLVGGTFLWLGLYAVSQSQVQRYLCCRTERESKLSLYLNFVGLAIVITFSCMCGLVMYAYYHTCDPVANGDIKRRDQILPFLVMEILGDYPGIPGIFVACVYSGSLSTVSTGINAMACVTVEDFIKPCTKLSDNTYCWISRGFGIVFGLLAIGMAYLASVLGGVLQAAISIFGLVGGPLLGLFTLGMIFPFANSWGALFGLASGLGSTIWLYVGIQTFKPLNSIINKLSTDTSGCIHHTALQLNNTIFNGTSTVIGSTFASTTYSSFSTVAPPPPNESYHVLDDFYSISYLYFSCVGFAVTLIIGLLLSIATCGHRRMKDVDPKLIFLVFDHWTLRWLPASFREKMRCGMSYEKCVISQKNSIELRNQSEA